MNKQELIKSIELQTYTYPDEPPKDGFGPTIAYKKGFNSCAEWAINLIEQLDELKKPIVKQFVADWFEENKDDLEFAIWKLTIDSNDNPTLSRNEMRNWIQYAPNKPYKTLIRMLEGYEIEKDPIFLMPVPYVPYPVHYCVDEDGKVSYRQGNAQKFTQEELDKYFPEIKQFAVPVEVDES